MTDDSNTIDRVGNTIIPWESGMVVAQKYELLNRLGRGGMGEVWKARDKVGEIEVALKVLPPELSGSPFAMNRVKENFKIVHGLVHEHIAAVLCLERHLNDFILVLEFVEGEDLRSYFKRYSSGSPVWIKNEAIRLCAQIASALDFSHNKRIMHRDIKPENIMIGPNGSAKLLDFGLAAEIHDSMSMVSQRTYETSGTRGYMAPEQWRGQPQDASTDQYALAVVLYELLGGRLPFQNPDPLVLRECVLKEAPEDLSGLTKAQNQALQKAMSKARNERFADCKSFIEALQNGKPAAVTQSKKTQPADPMPDVKKAKEAAVAIALRPESPPVAPHIKPNPNLLYCGVCGKTMSKSLMACPHCGHPINGVVPQRPVYAVRPPPPLTRDLSGGQRFLAIVLMIFCGPWLWIHRFYLGYYLSALVRIFFTILSLTWPLLLGVSRMITLNESFETGMKYVGAHDELAPVYFIGMGFMFLLGLYDFFGILFGFVKFKEPQ